MTLQQRWQLSLECVLVLFACSAGPASLLVWLNGAEASGAYWMMIGVPATASAAFVAISLLVPGLFAVGGLRFPLQITLPLTFSSLILLSAAMWTTTPEEIVSSFDVIRFARLWQQPGALLITLGAEMFGMAILTAFRRF